VPPASLRIGRIGRYDLAAVSTTVKHTGTWCGGEKA
jgi:hypothetical protein